LRCGRDSSRLQAEEEVNLIQRANPTGQENARTLEYFRLDWHFVDIVWLFQFPLFYILSGLPDIFGTRLNRGDPLESDT
jgi:hypothetical protein